MPYSNNTQEKNSPGTHSAIVHHVVVRKLASYITIIDLLSNLMCMANITHVPWLSLSWLWVCVNEAMRNNNVNVTNVWMTESSRFNKLMKQPMTTLILFERGFLTAGFSRLPFLQLSDTDNSNSATTEYRQSFSFSALSVFFHSLAAQQLYCG